MKGKNKSKVLYTLPILLSLNSLGQSNMHTQEGISVSNDISVVATASRSYVSDSIELSSPVKVKNFILYKSGDKAAINNYDEYLTSWA